MGKVKRYDICGHDGYAELDESGYYVTYDDYTALRSRVAELEAERDMLEETQQGVYEAGVSHWQARAEAAEALLSEAVKAGMLEAADVAKRMSDWDEMAEQWRNGCFSICADLRVKSENPETIAHIVAKVKEGRG